MENHIRSRLYSCVRIKLSFISSDLKNEGEIKKKLEL